MSPSQDTPQMQHGVTFEFARGGGVWVKYPLLVRSRSLNLKWAPSPNALWYMYKSHVCSHRHSVVIPWAL